METNPKAPVGMRIAFRSTGNASKLRWAEMSVWLAPQDYVGPRWQGLVVGKSLVDGETDRSSLARGYALADVLSMFDNSIPARFLRDEATAWAERNPDLCASRPIDLPFTGTTIEDALVWLYGAEALQQRGVNTRIAEDFGTGESSVRMARARGADLRVSLVEVCRYIDRTALAKARGLRAAIKEKEIARG